MRIGFTSDYFYPDTGGAERSALELAKALVKRGHDVTVYTRYSKGLSEEEELHGIRIKRIFRALTGLTAGGGDIVDQRIVDVAESRRLIKEVKKEDIEFLHSHNRDTAVFTGIAAKKAGIPHIAHIRDYWPICPKRDLLRREGMCTHPEYCALCMARFYGKGWKLPFYVKSSLDTGYRRKKLKSLGPFFIHISDYSRDILKLEPSRRIYNPIDSSLFENRGEEKGKVLYIGGITRHKGVDILLRAVKGLDIRLHLIGRGYLLSEISRDNVVKHGALSYKEVLRELSTAEFVVVPSIWPEPFGRVVVEAMAAGKPVIVSPYGALPEIAGNAGMVVRDFSEKSLRKEIIRLHEDQLLRDELSRKALERAKEFTPEKISADVISLYRKLKANPDTSFQT